jgi:hypothetical protein
MTEHPCGCRTEWVEDPDELCLPCLVIEPCEFHRLEAVSRRERRARSPLN